MPGPAVTIIASGGVPVTLVESGAPAFSIVESGGVGITLADNALPIVLDGSALVGALFANGEQGAWYDPSDLRTMSQTSDGELGNVAVGDPVGRIEDKSGNGNHRTQAVAGRRPTLQVDESGRYYLLWDGVDDAQITPSIDFTGTDNISLWAGIRRSIDHVGMIFELGATGSDSGIFHMACITGNVRQVISQGTALGVAGITGPGAPQTEVLCGLADISTPVVTLRINGVQAVQSAATQGTGNYSNRVLYFGSRGGTSIPFNGREYQTIIRGASTGLSTIKTIEAWVNIKTGAF